QGTSYDWIPNGVSNAGDYALEIMQGSGSDMTFSYTPDFLISTDLPTTPVVPPISIPPIPPVPTPPSPPHESSESSLAPVPVTVTVTELSLDFSKFDLILCGVIYYIAEQSFPHHGYFKRCERRGSPTGTEVALGGHRIMV
ncbi:MAG: hypothetical protein MMC33_009721, partial [Icmadophila ericetorum]|nr:hypothetical protein [Icmadophila ericetorum]